MAGLLGLASFTAAADVPNPPLTNPIGTGFQLQIAATSADLEIAFDREPAGGLAPPGACSACAISTRTWGKSGSGTDGQRA